MTEILSLSLSHIATDGQSVCLSWYRAPPGAHDQIFVTVWQFPFCLCGGGALSDERVGLSFVRGLRFNMGFLLYNVGTDRQKTSFISLSAEMFNDNPYPRKHCPVTGWFQTTYLHRNVFAGSLPSNGSISHNMFLIHILLAGHTALRVTEPPGDDT
jgi:hypothetical protein